FEHALGRAVSDGARSELEVRLKERDGGCRHVRIQLVHEPPAKGARAAVLAACQDVTAARVAEAELNRNERRNRSLNDDTPIMLHATDGDGRIVSVTDYWLKVLGFHRTEVLGRDIVEFMTDDSRRHALEKARPAFLCMGHARNVPYRFVKKNGEVMDALLSETGEWGAEGTLVRSVAVLVDVTEQKRAEERLRNSEATLRAVLEGISDAVFVKDLGGRYRLVNAAGARMLGRPVEDIIGRTDKEVLPETLAREHGEADARALATGKPNSSERELEVRGEGRQFLTTTGLYRDGEDKILGIVGVSRDITERKLMAEQLIQAQKMEAVGQLTGGVAHDFNNILAVVLGDLEILHESLGADPRHGQIAEGAMRAAQRGADLTRRLLAFSRRQTLQPEATDLNVLISDMTEMLRRALGETVQVETVAGAGLVTVTVYRSQMESAILNLALNARDAMPHGGRLRIATANLAIDATTDKRDPDLGPGRHASVIVEDIGVGMTPEVLERCFEPFFTTKEVGKGTGLGLAVVYGIVKQHGGLIHVYSEPGKGTAFRIYLPFRTEAVEAPAPPTAQTLARGSGTILLAEDDDSLRVTATKLLERLGYRVLPVANGRDAVELLMRAGQQIDGAILDVVMPGLAGPAVFEQVRHERPNLRFLFTTGYSPGTSHVAPLKTLPGQVLHKPYGIEALASAVRR
ncbi:MAG: PAS domain S-box protein, partial [Alphaproteobacteria bacterium]